MKAIRITFFAAAFAATVALTASAQTQPAAARPATTRKNPSSQARMNVSREVAGYRSSATPANTIMVESEMFRKTAAMSSNSIRPTIDS